MSIWKRPSIWASIALLLFLSASAAKSGGNNNGESVILNVVTPNQATNNQSAIGSVNQSPIGGVNNNTQINNSQATDYGFAPGIFCRGPSLSIGAFGNAATNNYGSYGFNAGSYGGLVALNIPLSGETNELCKQLAKEIVLQRQLDTSLNIIKQCAILQKEGIKFNTSIFPEFKKCEGVAITNNSSVPNTRPEAVFGARDKPLVTVPVR